MPLFQAPKAACSPDTIEDAARLAGDARAGRAAVADGATDSALQRLWAGLLVDAAVLAPPVECEGDGPRAWIEACAGPARAAWQQHAFSLDLPWHGWNKVRATGALATLIVVEWQAAPPAGQAAYWRALAVGDCTLFHLRPIPGGPDGSSPIALLASFPQQSAADYTSSPVALSSLRPLPDRPGLVQSGSGTLTPGDLLLIASDALALWLLARLEEGEEPLAPLLAISSDEDFAAFVAAERAARRLRDDDTTLLRIDL